MWAHRRAALLLQDALPIPDVLQFLGGGEMSKKGLGSAGSNLGLILGSWGGEGMSRRGLGSGGSNLGLILGSWGGGRDEQKGGWGLQEAI